MCPRFRPDDVPGAGAPPGNRSDLGEMKLKKIYEKIIESGRARDPRGTDEVDAEIAERKKAYGELKGIRREIFDTETLRNPYADTRILHGNPETDVHSVMVGIDIEGPELLLADWLRSQGRGPDLVMAHHPEGRALARLADVMAMQAVVVSRHGVPINVAEDLMVSRIREVDRRILPGNHARSVDFARILDIPMMCAHTPADNHVAAYLQELFDAQAPRKVKDVIDILYEHDEYRAAAEAGCRPTVFVGDDKRRAGKVFVDMTGGTEGSVKIYEKLSQAGVGTIVGMHISEEHRKQAEKHHVNVVIAGHIASDTLGLNLTLDEICRIEPIEIIDCSGFTRVERTRKKMTKKPSVKKGRRTQSSGRSSRSRG